MLSGTHFYHATIKRIVSVFGTLFNNITVGRHGSGNNISNVRKVPISYGPSQKFITRMNKDLDGQKVAIKLPRMSFEITSIEYDTTTKLNRLNTTLTSGTNNSPRTRNKMYQSVPYTIGMQLNILARNQEDALQIVEQIIPTFSPEYTVTIKDIEGTGSKTDVPFILNGISFDDTYEGDYQGRRTLTYTMDFTIRARFAPNTSNVNIIRKVETEIADFTNVSTSAAQTLSRITTRSDSPSDAIRTFISLIDPQDVHTVDLVYKDISVSGVEPLNKITAISITSGSTADFDRVEDENFSSTITNLSGIPSRLATANINGALNNVTNVVLDNNVGTISVGMKVDGAGVNSGITVTTVTDQNNIVLSEEVTLSDDTALTFLFGSGATFDAIIDGITGATTSVSLANRGDGYQATETITISSDHYSGTNLVLTVDSIADGTGDDPAGAILTFSVTSGNGANTTFANAFNPTFTRTALPTEPVLNSPLDSPGRHGSGATVDITLDKTGAVTTAVVNIGGADYKTTDSIKLGPVTLGETATSFNLENLSTDIGVATFDVTLDSQTGSLSNLIVKDGGSGYAIDDVITIPAASLGENSASGAALDTDLVLAVSAIDNSPNDPNLNAGDATGIITGVTITSGATGDIKRVGAKKYEYDNPTTELIMSIDTIDSTVINGTYTKAAGAYNNKPRYAHSTSSGVEIIYNGSDWVLRQGNNDLASASEQIALTTADSPVLNVPFTQWSVFGRDTANMVVSTTENLDFTSGEEIQGNISLGTANVISANNNKTRVDSLEALYVRDETITGQNSGIVRTVFSTRNIATTATFALSSNSISVDEGSQFTINLTTTNVANGTNVSYVIDGITSADISESLTGSFTVNNNTASAIFNTISDPAVGSAKIFVLKLDNNSGQISIPINNTDIAN